MSNRADWVRVLVLLVVLTAPLFVRAQNCSLCYTQAASAPARLIRALRSGILVLVVPPVFMSVGITVLAYRKRNKFRHPEEFDPELHW